MTFLSLAAAAMPGIIQGQQTRLELDEQDRRRKREDMDRFLAQRQQAMNLAIQMGDEGAFKKAIQDTPYAELGNTDYFSRQAQKRTQEEEDRARTRYDQDATFEASLREEVSSGRMSQADAFLAWKNRPGTKPKTKTEPVKSLVPMKKTMQLDPVTQFLLGGRESITGTVMGKDGKPVMGQLTTGQREVEINPFESIKPTKTALRSEDLGDRVVTYWSDGTQTTQKKGAAPQTFAPARPEMKLVMRNGKPVWAYPKDGEEAFITPSQGGAPKPMTELDQQRLVNSVTTGAHQDALRAAGAQPRQPDPSLATPQAIADYEKRAQAWGKKFQDAYSKALANRGYAQTFDGQLVPLGSAGAGTPAKPKLTIQDMPQGLGKAEQFQWMLDNLE